MDSRVASFNRTSFENANDGPGDIKVFDGDKIKRAPDKAVYYPIKYVQPYSGNERAYGYDVSSNPMAKEAQDYAFV
ncbi:CHASE domain-containing protein [Aliamphritea spongicola]|nr:CHASE domain-containing protein [Aliamphritea spongicola]